MTPELTTAQLQAFKAAIQADPTASGFLANGAYNQIAAYYNGASVTSAWQSAAAADLYQSMTISLFDNLTAGKRDAWRMLLDFAPADFRKAKFRKAVTDIWGASEAANVLNGCAVRVATKGEALFGGTDRTESTVTAKVLNTEGLISDADVEHAMRS